MAAAAILGASYDGKQPRMLGVAAATVSHAAGLPLTPVVGLTLSATVDARGGTVLVAAGACQLLSCNLTEAVEQQHLQPHPPQQQSQLSKMATSLLMSSLHSPATVAGLDLATADVAYPPAETAQHGQGFFLQPAMLHASSILHQLLPSPAVRGDAAAPVQHSTPAAFGCLLPGRVPDSSYPSLSGTASNSTANSSSYQWRVAAARQSLLLKHSSNSDASVLLQGLQYAQVDVKHIQASAEVAASSQICYEAIWQTVQPAPEVFAALSNLGRMPSAVLSLGSTALHTVLQKQLPGNGVLQAGLSGSSGSAVSLAGTGRVACFMAMQFLQLAATRRDSNISLATATPAALQSSPASCSPASGSRATSSAMLFGMLRCAASELPGMQITAGSVDELSTCTAAGTSPAWDPAFGLHGQQMSAGACRAARLLPALPSRDRKSVV